MSNKVNYFPNVTNLEELKQEYRKLCKLYHPDVNKEKDTTEIMVEINKQYVELGKKIPKSARNQETATEDDINDGFREVIDKIIHITQITVEICGTWIWVTGNTFHNKTELSNAGFSWKKQKKAWAWHPEGCEAKTRKPWEMDKIRQKYGSQVVKHNEQKKVI